MRKKMKNQKGFTLIELMITCILVLLFTSILTLGIQFAADNFQKTTTASEGQVLYRILTTAISDKIRFGEEMSNSDGTLNLSAFVVNDDGFLMMKSGDNETPLVSEKTYNNARIDKEEFLIAEKPAGTETYYEVRLVIVDKNAPETPIAGITEDGSLATFQVRRYVK